MTQTRQKQQKRKSKISKKKKIEKIDTKNYIIKDGIKYIKFF